MSSRIGMEVSAMSFNAMSEEEGKQKVAEGLSRILADTFTLYLKTQNFHWNVEGPMFPTLHRMFQDQYNELWLAVDLIAERLRALGFKAPGTFREFSELSYIHETDGVVPRAAEMIEELIGDHETVARSARGALSLARSTVDAPTEGLLMQRLTAHERVAWMLRSSLAEEGSANTSQRDNDVASMAILHNVNRLEDSLATS
ncbi:MAG TPA: DNA starvation/stationary phase protection protein [Terriglobales bacterium]|nr:DNA starvation/stationary phase protection protein [Terriglobales bacterium]